MYGMRADDAIRLRHMIEACELVNEFVAGRSRLELDDNRMLSLAVVRALEVIGEAASRMSSEMRVDHGDIPWSAMAGMRNRLIHAYFDIDADIVWNAATVEVPAPLTMLRGLGGGADRA